MIKIVSNFHKIRHVQQLKKKTKIRSIAIIFIIPTIYTILNIMQKVWSKNIENSPSYSLVNLQKNKNSKNFLDLRVQIPWFPTESPKPH